MVFCKFCSIIHQIIVIIMKYPCENCKLRAQYDKNSRSLIGRFWRWQINFCPSWRGYFKSLPAEEQAELRKKYNFQKY